MQTVAGGCVGYRSAGYIYFTGLKSFLFEMDDMFGCS